MENIEPVRLTPSEKAALLPDLTKQRVLEVVMEFLENSDLPTTIESLTDITGDLSELNSLVDKEEALSGQDLHDRIWTLNRFIRHYSELSWLILPVNKN